MNNAVTLALKTRMVGIPRGEKKFNVLSSFINTGARRQHGLCYAYAW